MTSLTLEDLAHRGIEPFQAEIQLQENRIATQKQRAKIATIVASILATVAIAGAILAGVGSGSSHLFVYGEAGASVILGGLSVLVGVLAIRAYKNAAHNAQQLQARGNTPLEYNAILPAVQFPSTHNKQQLYTTLVEEYGNLDPRLQEHLPQMIRTDLPNIEGIHTKVLLSIVATEEKCQNFSSGQYRAVVEYINSDTYDESDTSATKTVIEALFSAQQRQVIDVQQKNALANRYFGVENVDFWPTESSNTTSFPKGKDEITRFAKFLLTSDVPETQVEALCTDWSEDTINLLIQQVRILFEDLTISPFSTQRFINIVVILLQQQTDGGRAQIITELSKKETRLSRTDRLLIEVLLAHCQQYQLSAEQKNALAHRYFGIENVDFWSSSECKKTRFLNQTIATRLINHANFAKFLLISDVDPKQVGNLFGQWHCNISDIIATIRQEANKSIDERYTRKAAYITATLLQQIACTNYPRNEKQLPIGREDLLQYIQFPPGDHSRFSPISYLQTWLNQRATDDQLQRFVRFALPVSGESIQVTLAENRPFPISRTQGGIIIDKPQRSTHYGGLLYYREYYFIEILDLLTLDLEKSEADLIPKRENNL